MREQTLTFVKVLELSIVSLVHDCKHHKSTLVLMLSAHYTDRLWVHFHLLQAHKQVLDFALLQEPVQKYLQNSCQVKSRAQSDVLAGVNVPSRLQKRLSKHDRPNQRLQHHDI